MQCKKMHVHYNLSLNKQALLPFCLYKLEIIDPAIALEAFIV
jgi:hypothetical protein